MGFFLMDVEDKIFKAKRVTNGLTFRPKSLPKESSWVDKQTEHTPLILV